MTLVIIGSVIIALVVGWTWELLKAASLKIAELAKSLWAKIFKKAHNYNRWTS